MSTNLAANQTSERAIGAGKRSTEHELRAGQSARMEAARVIHPPPVFHIHQTRMSMADKPVQRLVARQN